MTLQHVLWWTFFTVLPVSVKRGDNRNTGLLINQWPVKVDLPSTAVVAFTKKKLQASYLSWIQTTAGLVTRITTPFWKVRIVQKIQMAIRTPLIVSRKILFKLRTTDWCALAAHHNPVVSSWHYLISHWLTIVLPTNEKSDSLNKARAHQSVVLDLD